MGNIEQAIAAIRRKVTRAHDQMHSLAIEMETFQTEAPDAYGLVRDRNTKGTEHIYYLEFRKPIPVDWSVILGEAIHNLRSALDQCVFQLYLANKMGRERKGSAFPIFYDPDGFRRFGRDNIRGIGHGPRAFIESLQP